MKKLCSFGLGSRCVAFSKCGRWRVIAATPRITIAGEQGRETERQGQAKTRQNKNKEDNTWLRRIWLRALRGSHSYQPLSQRKSIRTRLFLIHQEHGTLGVRVKESIRVSICNPTN